MKRVIRVHDAVIIVEHYKWVGDRIDDRILVRARFPRHGHIRLQLADVHEGQCHSIQTTAGPNGPDSERTPAPLSVAEFQILRLALCRGALD